MNQVKTIEGWKELESDTSGYWLEFEGKRTPLFLLDGSLNPVVIEYQIVEL